jgi:hypothetical protein
VLFASCGARKLVLGGSVGEEVTALANVFDASVPIAGFYSYGEVGPASHDERGSSLNGTVPRYHNCTLVACAL